MQKIVQACLLKQGNICNLEMFITGCKIKRLKLLLKQRMFSFAQ